MSLAEAAAEAVRTEPWSLVVGQPRAVASLAPAVASPVHAYLLVGPRARARGPPRLRSRAS